MFPNLPEGVNPSNIFKTRKGRDYIMSLIESDEQAINILNIAKLQAEIAKSKLELSRSQAGETTDELELGADDELQEKRVVKRLVRKLKGQTEVVTPVGRIDLLTETELIEVKPFHAWKAAIGQVLAYAHYYPNHIKRIHLFRSVPRQIPKIQEVCQALDVTVTTEGRKGK